MAQWSREVVPDTARAHARRLLVRTPAALLAAGPAAACSYCRPSVEAMVYAPGFLRTLVALVLPLIILCAIGGALHFVDSLVRGLPGRQEVGR